MNEHNITDAVHCECFKHLRSLHTESEIFMCFFVFVILKIRVTKHTESDAY